MADSEEFAYAADGWQTDALIADSDGDSLLDSLDNCPLSSNSDQADQDGDGDGDVCDCQSVASAAVPNPEGYHHRATDHPDLRLEDRNCDDLDGTHDGDVVGIYVRAAQDGDGSGDGSRAAPYTDLATAWTVAMASGRDLYVADGDYDTTGLAITAPIRVYGGFDADFTTRTLDASGFATVFRTDTDAVQFDIDGVDDGVLQGLTLIMGTLESDIGHIALTDSTGWHFEGLSFELDPAAIADQYTGIRLTDSADILVSASNLGASGANDEHVGIAIGGSEATVRNVAISGSDSESRIGIEMTDASEVAVLHSTIDTDLSAAGFAAGISVSDSTLTLRNSSVIAGDTGAVSALLCAGTTAAITLESSMFEFVGSDGSIPIYVDCRSQFYMSVSDLDTATDVDHDGLSIRTDEAVSSFSDDYHLMVGNTAIDAGATLTEEMTESDAGIAIDRDLEDRNDGAPDMGADEL